MFEQPQLLISAAAIGTVIVGLAVVLVRLYSNRTPDSDTAKRSSMRLAPMRRLLQEEDFQFLASQRGFTPEIAKSLRTKRVAIFKQYLTQLSAEFHRAHLALHTLTLYAKVDRSETLKILLQQRMLFSFRMAEVHLRLALFSFGVKPADVSGLVQTVETMRQQVASMAASTQFQASMAGA